MTKRWVAGLLGAALACFLLPTASSALVIQVQDPSGNPVFGFRWLVEEDTTHAVNPGVSEPDVLSFSVHRSYAPPVRTGSSASFQTDTDAPPFGPLPTDTRYHVSVLPNAGHAIGGGNVAVGQTELTVVVQPLPLPTAQITILAFRDNDSINNEPDLPQEIPDPLDPSDPGMAGFSVKVSDLALQVQKDVWGNPLGTSYQTIDGITQLDPDGNPIVDVLGDGVILTNFFGRAVVKNLAPGKYAVELIPPAGEGWIQTSTIEGTTVVDAWVKANEPPFFAEFGPPGVHVFIGFVQPFNNLPSPPAPDATAITGRVVGNHLSRPPVFTFFKSAPVEDCYIGLNQVATAAPGAGLYVAPCNPDGSFEIPNVPPGNYQLAVWDKPLDQIFGLVGVTVPPGGGSLDLGDVALFRWFGTIDNYVFFDSNENGFPDPGEPPMPLQNVNLRYRDGTMYQFGSTDLSGRRPFGETFPFFHWQVAEVDFARFKATGATVVVDAGGAPSPDPVVSSWLGTTEAEPKLTPQAQPDNGGLEWRTEVGTVLTQAFQSFLGATSRIFWGKSLYGPGENGGITGMVRYATTRAEDDPQFALAEGWEPGIPRVQLALYQDSDADGQIDDLDADGIELADVDNHPFGNFPGAEDLDRNANGIWDGGDAIAIATTDSWDDTPPVGCPGQPGIQAPFYIHGDPSTPAQECFEGLRTFNQVRPGVFDGSYAFDAYFPGGIDSGSAEVQGLPNGGYIVEASPPPVYETVQAEDKNVDFGDTYTPGVLALPPTCVGDDRVVPDFLTLFPSVPAPFAGQTRRGCDRKQIAITGTGQNSAVDFFMFTEVPKAGRIVGFILDDLSNEFDPTSPQFGEKYAPPWLPVSIRDWAGVEISRVYSDEYGQYNSLVPSTYTANVPIPSGMSPNMITVCLNHPGPIPDPANPGQMMGDPFYNPSYSQFCYTFQYMPGTTTYLDTPVVPVAAHAGVNQAPLDCEAGDGIPLIQQVDGPIGGPYVAIANGTQSIAIHAAGDTLVQNPAYDPIGAPSQPILITRDYGFGDVPGSVSVGGIEIPSSLVTWSNDTITAVIPSFITSGQLLVTRGDNFVTTPLGITLTVSGPVTTVSPGQSIQAAIDAAPAGSTVLVLPGSYEQNPILWKDIKLQGSGAGSTILNSFNNPAEKLITWRNKIQSLFDAGDIQLIPGQGAPGGASPVEPERGFVTEEGPGVTVITRDGVFGPASSARIDGFSITGADNGGGIFVNGFARNLEISNNRILGNQGVLGGGIRVGFPGLIAPSGAISDAQNDDLRIHHNQILRNGGLQGPGGIALYTGSQRYEVSDNLICGNFSAADAGGIGHIGLSPDGRIADNEILFNEAWNNTSTGSGGGIFVSGAFTGGTGSVSIEANLIQGNEAGTGDGGGIRAEFVSGTDVFSAPVIPSIWNELSIIDNVIVNNVAGMAGAVSLQDAPRSQIVNNTIANNDSTATAQTAFQGNPNLSVAQPAGIVSYAHTPALAANIGAGVGREFSDFSNPLLANNIIWRNRSFHWFSATGSEFGGLVPNLSMGGFPVYDDLAVVGTAAPASLEPQSCLLTDTSAYAGAGNISGDPGFVSEYVNGARSLVIQTEQTIIGTAVTFDEGGNFIDMSYGPLTRWNPSTGLLFGDYHLNGATSPAAGAADASLVVGALLGDFDGDPRPTGVGPEMGADELKVVSGGAGSPGGGGGLGSCGLGFELGLLLPAVLWIRQRRSARPRSQE